MCDRAGHLIRRNESSCAGLIDEAAPIGASALPEVDDVLTDTLTAQGEAAYEHWNSSLRLSP